MLGFALADGTGLLPALLAIKVPVLVAMVLTPLLLELLATLLCLLLPLFWGPVLAFTLTKLLHEFVDHVLERTTAATAATASATSSSEATTTSTTTTAAEGLHHLADELHGVLALAALLFLLLGLVFFLVGNDDHNVGGAAGLSDFDHGVLMALTFLTGGT